MDKKKQIEEILFQDYGRIDKITVDKLCALLDVVVSSSLKEDRMRIFEQLLIEEEETAFSSKIIVHTDDVYNVLFKGGTIKP